jgi:hypothetical protein
VDGRWYSFSTTPAGDELKYGPYRGDMGVLEVGPGGRAITKLGVAGVLTSKDGYVTLGEYSSLAPPQEFPRRHEIPVGDYTPMTLSIQYDRLRFNMRMLTDRDRGPGREAAKPAEPSIKIRKDKPVVLEFSGKPEVVFLNPAKGQSIRPGQETLIRALLTEPFQGVVITGIYDVTRKTGERKYRIDGQDVVIPQYVRLDPTIVIKNSKGEKVAEGTMPFG